MKKYTVIDENNNRTELGRGTPNYCFRQLGGNALTIINNETGERHKYARYADTNNRTLRLWEINE